MPNYYTQLADLIEEGQAHIDHQMKHDYVRYAYTGPDNQKLLCACIVGCALIGSLGHKPNEDEARKLTAAYLSMGKVQLLLEPRIPTLDVMVLFELTSYNDDHNWTISDAIEFLRERGRQIPEEA